MSLATLKRKVRNLEALVQLRQRNDTATLDAIRADPTTLMTRANMVLEACRIGTASHTYVGFGTRLRVVFHTAKGRVSYGEDQVSND